MDRFGLSAHEWLTLQFSILWAFEAIAASDNNIDAREQSKLKEIIARPRSKASPLVRGVWASMTEDFDKLRDAYRTDRRDIPQGLAMTVTLLSNRATPAVGEEFRSSLLKLGREVAGASGGFLGFGDKVSDVERDSLAKLAALLDLAAPAPKT